PTGLSNVTAIAGGESHSLALKSDGTVVAWGWNYYGQTSVPAGLSGVSAIAADGEHSLALVPADTTPPAISASVSGTSGTNGWYVGDVTVSWSVTDAESAISSRTGCDALTISQDTDGTTLTCSATSRGGTASQSVTIKRDTIAPSITFASRTAPNAAGWNNSAVTLSWSCADSLSGAVAASVSQTIGSEGANQSATGTCTDNAGNSASDTQSGINIDTTAPTLTPAVSPNPVLLGGSATVTSGAADTLSGLASQSCGSLDTSSVGTKS